MYNKYIYLISAFVCWFVLSEWYCLSEHVTSVVMRVTAKHCIVVHRFCHVCVSSLSFQETMMMNSEETKRHEVPNF